MLVRLFQPIAVLVWATPRKYPAHHFRINKRLRLRNRIAIFIEEIGRVAGEAKLQQERVFLVVGDFALIIQNLSGHSRRHLEGHVLNFIEALLDRVLE